MTDTTQATARIGLPAENAYGHTKKLRFILEALERERAARNRPLRVLDFGCGNGSAVTRFLAGPGIDLHGVDIHRPSLAHARAHYAGPGLAFHAAIPDGMMFDVIVYADVLEHLDDPTATMREHAGRLAPGGLVVGAVPNGYGPFEIENRIDRVVHVQRLLFGVSRLRRRLSGGEIAPVQADPADAVPYNHDSGHLVFFTREALGRSIADAGLTREQFAHGSLFCGPVSTPLLRGRLVDWNVRAADSLPYWAVSVWYFTARRLAASPPVQ